jgi:ligand-binding sensor domain-containing protein
MHNIGKGIKCIKNSKVIIGMPVLKQIKKTTKWALCYCTCLLYMTLSTASAQQVTFNRVSPPPGSILINGIAQDIQGYMWFSAYGKGLYRYDGYHFSNLRNDPRDTSSLATNNVTCVFADHNGLIWTGTQSGLDRMDPVTGIFRHFRYKAGNLNSLSNDTINAILEDHDGTLWVGTQNGLNRMDRTTGTFTRFFYNSNDPYSLSCNRVQVLYEDRQGTLWVGCPNKEKITDPSLNGGLNRFNPKTGKFTRFLHDPKVAGSLADNRIGAIFEDSRGVFYVSTAGDGLHTMDREKGVFERHPYDPAHPDKLSGPPPEKEWLDLNNFVVTEDSSGAIWIASTKKWITRYDPKTKKAQHFNSLNNDIPSARMVSEAYSSREGVLWFATWEGNIFRVDPFQVTIPHVFTGSRVYSVHEDFSGALWLGTDKGLIQTGSTNASNKRFFTELPGPYGLPDKWLPVFYEDDDSTLWIGSSNGLNHYNPKTKIFARYVNDPKNKNSLSAGGVTSIVKEKPGLLWIGTTKGLNRFDTKGGLFTHYQKDPNDSTSLGSNNVSSLLKDHAGNLWAGNWNGMLNVFDSRTGKFKHFLCGEHIGNITEDAGNIIWVGTSNGLYKSNRATDSFFLFTDPEIGLTASSAIGAIHEDNKKNLWVSTSAGILRLSPNRNEICVYSKNQGVDGSGLTLVWGLMRGAKGKRGELFFGDRTGYYAFFPDQLKRNTTAPQIVITDFRLADNKPVKPGKSSPLKYPVAYTDEIHLKYNQNVFSFDFTGIHYSSPEDIRFLFLMENLENTWKKSGPGE